MVFKENKRVLIVHSSKIEMYTKVKRKIRLWSYGEPFGGDYSINRQNFFAIFIFKRGVCIMNAFIESCCKIKLKQ